MAKRFNTTGTYIPERHYMVDIKKKVNKIIKMIEQEDYLNINRPRQYGKTTILLALEKKLSEMGYLVLSLSFEGMGSEMYKSEKSLIEAISFQFKEIVTLLGEKELLHLINENIDLDTLDKYSFFITQFIRQANKRVVLMIDEVDKNSDNQMFLNLLGVLRNKYLKRSAGKDQTFHSVILTGVHDVKTLKLKFRPDEERKYNGPWNIAAEFDVDMSFEAQEISTMLEDYIRDRNMDMDKKVISEKLYYYTSGYPFLVSRLCQIIDEKILPEKWQVEDVNNAFKMILKESNPNFDDLIKNLENIKELYEFIQRIVIDGENISFVRTDNIISLGAMYGIINEKEERCVVHNKIYEALIYDHMMMKTLREKKNEAISNYNFRDNFIENGMLDIEKVILKFQQFMREQYSERDEKFLEREGRLVLLAFIKPIINGQGVDFKEVQVSEERRLDIVITYLNKKYVLELKRWNGEKAHQKGLRQLKDYLDRVGVEKGFLVIFDFTRNRDELPASDRADVDGKEIFMVRV